MDITIRFPQIDVAGIMFYPRCFELLQRYFPDSPLENAPFGMRTTFAQPLRLGDRVSLALERDDERWAFSGASRGSECFRVESRRLGPPPSNAPAFRSQHGALGGWACGPSGRMALSRSFEFLNMAAEEYLERVLDLPFHELHVGRRLGIPTARFHTQVFALPRWRDEIHMATEVGAVGSKSLTLRHQLRRAEECLVETEQVVVFVEMQANGYRSVPIPDDLRALLKESADVAT